MASKIAIWNLGLGHLGMKAVTSESEDSPSADALNNVWTIALEELFSEGRWPFATAKEALVSVSDDTLELEWSYLYIRPTHAMTVWNVYNEATISNKEEQQFEVVYQPSLSRRIICTNLETAYAEYTYNVIDTTLYSPKFVMALSYKLASKIAPTLLRDVKVASDMMNMAKMVVDEAKITGFAEKRNKIVLSSSYRDAR